MGRNPKNGQKKGGIKVHKIIRAEEGVASGIKFTSAATHDSFMFAPGDFSRGDLLAMDRAYIDYEKLEQLSQNGVVYVTKMKKGLKYQVISDVMYMDAKGGMAYRIQEVEFTKKKGRKDDGSADGDKHAGTKGGKMGSEVITHRARIVTYPDVKRRKGKGGKEIVTGKMVSLLTNDFTMEAEDIIAIYKKRWEIETLFYDKFIVMRSHSKCISDYQNVTYLLLISALHNMVAMTSFHLNVRTNGYQKDFL